MPCLNQDEWLETPLGRYLYGKEQAYFDQAISDVFGYHAVQFGWAKQDFLKTSRIPRKLRADKSGADVLLDFCQLPFSACSIDLAVLPHTLEFSANPHQVLREMARIMRPEGQIVISGFNPYSLWGCKRVMRQEYYPWCGNFISLPRIKDWFQLLGFEVTEGQLCCYAPPFEKEKWLSRFGFMEASGDRWWPISGGVYFLKAIKRIHGVRLIRPNWNPLMAKNPLAPAVKRYLEKDGQ